MLELPVMYVLKNGMRHFPLVQDLFWAFTQWEAPHSVTKRYYLWLGNPCVKEGNNP